MTQFLMQCKKWRKVLRSRAMSPFDLQLVVSQMKGFIKLHNPGKKTHKTAFFITSETIKCSVTPETSLDIYFGWSFIKYVPTIVQFTTIFYQKFNAKYHIR